MWFDFRWIQNNEAAIADHGVSKAECEWVVSRNRPTRIGDRFIAVGQTGGGRKLKVIYEMDDALTIFVVIAYPVR